MAGKLILCATPIGNLEDITVRVLNTLKEVDYIAAEDTRHTLKLLNHYGISKPLISYHEHNMHKAGDKIFTLIAEGNDVALVSDAGMPGISDPGSELVKEAWERGIVPTVLPGPTAFAAALVLSGLSTDRFAFEGFLPNKKSERYEWLNNLKDEERTMIFYEAPHRLMDTLNEMSQIFGGDRKGAVLRELTKIHEEVVRGNLDEIIDHFKDRDIKGELVIVLEGLSHDDRLYSFKDITIKEHIEKYMECGLSKKEAVKQVARDRGIPKSEVYKHSINI